MFMKSNGLYDYDFSISFIIISICLSKPICPNCIISKKTKICEHWR